MQQLITLVTQLLARPASVATTGEVVSEAKEPTGGYNQPLANGAPDLTKDNNQTGPGNPTGQTSVGTWDENSPIKGVVSDFSEGMKNAMNKSGTDRLAAFQEILNNAGTKMKEIHLSLETEPTTKSEGQPTVNVEEVVNRVLDEKLDQKLIPVQAGMAELKSLIQGITVGKAVTNTPEKKTLETPKMKSIVSPTNVPQVQKSQLKSIMDIATETTFGTLGK